MTPNPLQLLGLLGSSLSALSGKGRAGGGGADGAVPLRFDELLDRARAGGLETGAPVDVRNGVNAGLSESDLARVGRAVDAAEASGAQSAAVVLDGKVLRVDVTRREITGVVMPGAAPLGEVDTVVFAPAGEEDGTDGSGGSGGGADASALLRGLGRGA